MIFLYLLLIISACGDSLVTFQACDESLGGRSQDASGESHMDLLLHLGSHAIDLDGASSIRRLSHKNVHKCCYQRLAN